MKIVKFILEWQKVLDILIFWGDQTQIFFMILLMFIIFNIIFQIIILLHWRKEGS